MPVKVTFNEFTRGESRAVLGMNVEAVKPTAAASGAARRTAAAAGGAPKSYAFTVEFLDRSGAVVDTQQVSVGPVAPGPEQDRQGRVGEGGVVAFRYRMA
jgi:hypothetical protein